MRVRPTWLWLIPLLLVTFWLGAHFLDARPIWQDETFSLRDAGIGMRSPADIWNEVATRNPWHPPGFFIILNAWGNLTGPNPPALRLLSVMFGLLAVVWTYRLGRDNVSPRVGLIAAATLGTTVMLAYYLDQIRVYTLLTLLTTFTLWQYLRIIRLPSPRPRDWLCLCATVTVMLYAHYFAGIILAAIGLYHLLIVRKDRRWLAVTGVFALAGALFLPWVGVLFRALNMFFGPAEFNDRALTNGELIEVLARLFSNGLIVLLVAAVVLALLYTKRGGWRFWFFAAATLIPLLVLNQIFRVIPITRLRYLLMLWPLFSLLVAMGIAWVGEQGKIGRRLSTVMLLIWVGAGLLNVTNPALIQGLGGGGDYYPFQRVDRVLRPNATAEDLILGYWPAGGDPPDYNVVNYYNRGLPTKQTIITALDGEAHDIDLDIAATHDRIWLSYVPERPVEEAESFSKVQAFVKTYAQCDKPADSPALSVTLYARTPVCCGPDDQPIARFGDGAITLTGIDSLADADNHPTLTLGWSVAPDVPIHTYSVTLQLFDDSGNKVAQNDYGLLPRAYACQTSVFDTGAVPPGDYDLRASVYAWQTQERLPAVSADGQTGDMVRIGSVHVGESAPAGA